MDKLSCTDIAQWSAAGCAGLVMGGAFFTNSTAAPALEKTEDTKSALQCWRSLFNTSGNFQVSQMRSTDELLQYKNSNVVDLIDKMNTM